MGGRLHILPQTYKFYYDLCLNNLPQVLLIGNQRDQVTSFRCINQADDVHHFFIGRKVLRDMKHLMKPVKQEAEEVGIWTEEDWDVK